MSHISEVVDSLSPGVLAHVVIADLQQWFREDLEAKFGFGGVGGVEVRVDLAGRLLAEDGLAVYEGTITDV